MHRIEAVASFQNGGHDFVRRPRTGLSLAEFPAGAFDFTNQFGTPLLGDASAHQVHQAFLFVEAEFIHGLDRLGERCHGVKLAALFRLGKAQLIKAGQVRGIRKFLGLVFLLDWPGFCVAKFQTGIA
jgi:hypothetical protein